MTLAGGTEKFKTAVVVDSKGVCTWRSPATFKSDCEISVRYWPFDTQKCKLFFASYTYDNEQLSLKLLAQSKNKAGDHFWFRQAGRLLIGTNTFVVIWFLDSYTTNGDWSAKEITLSKQVHKQDSLQYDRIAVEVVLSRRPEYFVLNLITPSAVLCLLTLFSFAIPSESGERVGFITTLLLAMTVYLLIIADVLPETSKQLPIIGLLFVLMITETALILLFTIVILRCYHSEGEPYRWLQRIYCCCCPWKNKTPSGINKSRKKELPIGVTNQVQDGDTPYDIPAAFEQYESKEFDHPTWQDISVFVNRMFFFVSIIMVISTFLVVYVNASYFSQTEL